MQLKKNLGLQTVPIGYANKYLKVLIISKFTIVEWF